MAAVGLQEIVCCMGLPVAGNPTQFMIERAFVAAGLDWRYLTLEVPPQRLVDAVRGMKAMGFRGGNFTIPHKTAVIPLLDGLSPAAELMGAVNCVYRDGERLIGENTDGKGFVESLRTVCDPSGKRIAILGAGGAARAIAVELGLSGAAEITIINRSEPRGRDLVELLQSRVKVAAQFAAWGEEASIPENIEIVVNATSVGLNDGRVRVPVNAHTLLPPMTVADVVFNPPRTRFLREAEERGCRILDGLGMLVNQGAIGFKIWTGKEPDRGLMRESLEEFFGV